MTELTLDLVARYPRPGMTLPGKLAFSPDGKTLTFLHSEEGDLARALWSYDVETGARAVFFSPAVGVTDENISRDEELRRERERLLHTGVTHYQWAARAPVVLVPVRGELWIVDASGARVVGRDAIDPHLSPDGARVAFVREGDVYVIEVATGEERRLTSDAEPGRTNGRAEFIAQEEMGRASGLWWSEDGARLAYAQADERHIPVFTIPHWGTDTLDVEEHHYPFAGAENARVRLGVVSATGGDTMWLDLGDAEYLARVDWHADGRLFVQVQPRDQCSLTLRAFDAGSGAGSTLLVEQSDVWVNLHDSLRFLEETGEFVWASERTGLKQLYLYAAGGTLVRAITDAAFPVDGVLAIDQSGRRVAYTAATTPTESHVFIASLDGGEPEQVTKEPGMHSGVFAADFSTWAEVDHSVTRAPSITVHAITDSRLHAPATVDLPLVTPEFFTFAARDGETLHGMLYRPATMPAPLIVHVYGGPHAQTVTNSWASTVDLRAQYLAAQGYLVMSVDNRGSARRGIAFEGAIRHRMGSIEIDDQADGVAFARAQGWVRGDAAGMYGWSYGGYMTIMSMLKAPDVFTVGVAGAPVTAWDGYDTYYTEHYMGTPAGNPHGYRDGSAMTHAAALRGRLLVVHGMIDENVHFRHTARFLDALAKANRPCDLLVYPEERHMPRSEKDRRAMEERVVDYFRTHLA